VFCNSDYSKFKQIIAGPVSTAATIFYRAIYHIIFAETGDFSFRLEQREEGKNTILNNNDDDIGMIITYYRQKSYLMTIRDNFGT